ncbi:phage tail protein [Pararhizobium sp. BT-229]|uniref:phage tail protein n=1 Tax=Pararhizobium sp. BT-229 TaxID=2986923 RepID=UPI0021F7901A|nr:phage tail protein [Pararhizobium sp. BT-229]MCV9961726.1 phage tail protein [Pararhizobium sp. BT-229]
MSTLDNRTYRFSSAKHWDRCLAFGFDAPGEGGLRFTSRLGVSAVRVGPATSISAVASDRLGVPTWRAPLQSSGGEEGLAWLDEFDGKQGPFPVDETIRTTLRLQLDRHWLWAFGADRVVRYDRMTLQKDTVVPVDRLSGGEDARLLDIASDGTEGAWVLVDEGERQKVVLIDCQGCKAIEWMLPCEVIKAAEVAIVNGGKTLALLSPADQRLFLIGAGDGVLIRAISLGAFDRCFQARRISSDARARLGLSGFSTRSGAPRWQFYLLDRQGEVIDGPIDSPFAPLPSTSRPEVEIADFAVAGDRVWFATNSGLWRLDAGDVSGGKEAHAVLLTPLLYSPPDGTGRGWMRAGIEIDLPEGAATEVSFATTDDPETASRIETIMANESLPKSIRQDAIWTLLAPDPDTSRTFSVSGGSAFGGKVDVPLFGTGDAWLVLKLRADVPPFVGSPSLRGMRITYGQKSLMQYLPAIFSDPKNDPEKLLRRLVGVVETTSQGIDAKIASIGRMIDAEKAPGEWLDYLGSWLDLPWHSALDEGTKRALLKSAGYLLQWRGTKRGLQRLVECIAGQGGSVEVIDVAAEHAPMRLGGNGLPGTALGLLAGYRPSTATLGLKAVLGRAKLGCARGQPVDILVPTLLIAISSVARIRRINAPYLDSILAQYVPAGVRHRVRWETVLERGLDEQADGLILEAQGPGTLGTDTRLGRTVLAGRTRLQIGTGVEMGFTLR